MVSKLPKAVRLSGSRRTGIVTGLAFGVAVSTVLAFESGALILLGGLPLLGLLPLVLGPAIGAILAKVGAVPYLRLAPMCFLALAIASLPFVAGAVETRLRTDPFKAPSGAEVIRLTQLPWGERTMILGSAEEVPVFFDQLVNSATEAGWICRRCEYQPSTGTGHAHFWFREPKAGSTSGQMGFEVWPGQRALYGTSPSELTLARIFHNQVTLGPRYSLLVLTLVLLATSVARPHFKRSRT